MPLLITNLVFGDVNTISIPTDALVIVALLIVLGLLGYFFNNILYNDTNQINQNINVELVKSKLKNELILETTIRDEKNMQKQSIRKLDFLPPSKLLGLGSLTLIIMGGTGLLGLQQMQKAYEGWSTRQTNITQKNQSEKSPSSMIDVQGLYKSQNKIQKISFINSFLLNSQSTNKNYYSRVKKKHLAKIKWLNIKLIFIQNI